MLKLRYTGLAAFIALTGALCGCSSQPDPALQKDPDSLILRLSINTGKSVDQTRADKGQPDRYDDPVGDFEKIQEMRIIIIHDLNDAKTSGIVEANRQVATSDEGYPLNDNLEFKVVANENKRIYLIANEDYLTAPEGFTDPNPYNPQPLSTKFLDSFEVGNEVDLTSLTNWEVSLPGITDDTKTVTQSMFGYLPNNQNTRLPLTEFFDIFVDRSKAIDEVFTSNMFLTRAACKVAFFLNTGENFTAGEAIRNTRITAISITGIGTTEYVFPNNAVYSPTKEELTAPGNSNKRKEAFITSFNTPQSSKQVTYLISDLNEEITKPDDSNLIKFADGFEGKRITNTFYIPESILNSDEQFMVNVQLDGQNWISAPLNENILNIGGQDAIARDTYLPILMTFVNGAAFNLNVLPWNREDYYVDFSANIGFNQNDYLNISGTGGQTGDYLLLDKEAAQLVLNYGKTAHGSFFISSPAGSQWDAYLITTGGTTDAIQFQVPDPADKTKTITTTHISGKVGQDKADFGIVATVAPGAEQNSAQLMVIVTLANGTPVVANVLGPSWGSETNKPDRLTIIENQQ